ncbi:MAG: biliverdin-producing heme oxygenase [Polyangiales bacterium]
MELQAATPIAAIRTATRTMHERIDSGPYARAILDGTLPVGRYASFLRALHVVHGELEHAVEMSGNTALRDAFVHGVERRQRLERDIAFLQTDIRGVDAAVLHAVVLSQQVRADARQSAAALFGHLYVLEGSQLGGLALRMTLAKRPEFQEGGLAYLSGAGRDTATQFKAFIAKLEASLGDEAAVAEAVAGAQHAFAGIEAILEAVMSERLDGPRLAEALNLAAGTHPVPGDLREIQAALRAGEQSYRAFAYYEARYGDRGLRFTRSDSAWLATLCHERSGDDTALRQVDWLARVLAARGMPRLLMERHLEQLHTTLTACVPEAAASYEPLRRAAEVLERERTALLSEARTQELASEFKAQTSAGITQEEAGLLLVAAVLDEKRGVGNAVESLVQWLGDPTRFPADWRSAIDHTVHTARAAF